MGSVAHPVKKPRQARSAATLERLLNSTEQLLKTRKFAEITVNDIIDGAASSVGAFYKRFTSKDDVLPYLLERLQARQLASIEAFVADPQWQGVGLADRVRVFTDILSKSYLGSRGLIRALVTRQFSDRSELPDDEIRKAREIVDLIAGWLRECADEVNHESPEEAIRVGMFIAVTSLQVGILFQPSTKRFSNKVLVDEVTRALLAYLGTNHPSTPPKGRS